MVEAIVVDDSIHGHGDCFNGRQFGSRLDRDGRSQNANRHQLFPRQSLNCRYDGFDGERHLQFLLHAHQWLALRKCILQDIAICSRPVHLRECFHTDGHFYWKVTGTTGNFTIYYIYLLFYYIKRGFDDALHVMVNDFPSVIWDDRLSELMVQVLNRISKFCFFLWIDVLM